MNDTYYWKSPDVAIIRLDDGNVLFRSDTLALRLESESVNLLIEKIFPLLDGAKSLREIALHLEVPESSLAPHLETLVEKGILKAGSEPYKAVSGFEKFLLNAFISAEEIASVQDKFTIAIFGLEAEGVLVANILLASGVRNLMLVDPFSLQEENRYLLNEYKNADLSELRQEIIKRELQRNFPGSNIQLPIKDITRESVNKMMSETDFAVCCFDKNFIAANYWINVACIENNKPVIFSDVKGHTSVVGPMVIPGQTACYMCYKMRSMANADDFELTMATERYLSDEKKPALHKKAFLHAAVNYNASVLSGEILKYIFSLGNPALASRVIFYNNFELSATNHHILQVPECTVCKKKTDRVHSCLSKLLSDDIYKSEILGYKDLLVSDQCGIINKLGLFQKDMGEPSRPIIFRADLSNHRFLKKKDFTDNTCSGKGLSEEKALVSALGEAIERYSGACYYKNEILYTTYSELNGQKLNPEDLVLFSPEQYKNLPYQPYSHDSMLGWVPGHSLINDRFTYVPALSIFMNYELQSEHEHICQITSNGLAAGSSLLNAILSAALEIIERDAFIIAWHNKLCSRRVDPLSFPDKDIREYIIAYKRRGVELMLFELPTDFPTKIFLALGVNLGQEGPFVVAGLGADFDMVAAARGALLEVGQVRPALKKRLRQKEIQNKLEEIVEDPTKVRELEDHDLLFASKRSAPALEFLLGKEEEPCNWTKNSSSGGEKLRLLLEYLGSINSDLIYYNLTPRDMEKLGLYTARVIIPQMQPIHFGYYNIRLGGKRMLTQAQKLGFSNKPRTIDDIDLFPHPLA